MTLTLSADSIRPVAGLFRRLKFRSTLPILDHIRLTVAEGEAEALLETTDLDVLISVRLPIAGPTTPGAFTVPRADFFQLASKSDKGSLIRFECPMACEDACAVHIHSVSKTLRSERTVTSLPPGEFPPAPVIEGTRVIFPSAALDAIRRVRPATSNDLTRHVLNGVFLTPAHGGAVVATDGRRLATVATRIPCPDSILPNAVADLLLDPACQSAAVWCHQEENATLTFGKTRLAFRLIKGNFPNYRQVIPQSYTSSCTLPAAIVPAVIAWLKPHGKDTVKLEFGANVVALKIKDSSTSVPALITGPAPESIAFNAAFLVDALTMGLHTIDMNTGAEPGVLTDGPTRYVLMPMRVTEAAAAPQPESEEPSESEAEPALS